MAPILQTKKGEESLLHSAAFSGSEPLVNLAIELGCSIQDLSSSEDGDPVTPLWTAAERGHVRALQLLISHGADVNDGGRHRPPVCSAALRGHGEALSFLVNHGASLSSVDGHRRTALHYAARGGKAAVVQQILNYGLDASTTDADGNTSLHKAAISHSSETIRLLLENGASIEVENSHGQTPFAICAGERHLEGLILLKAKGANPHADQRVGWGRGTGTPLLQAAYRGDLMMAQLLVEMGADPCAFIREDGAGIVEMMARGGLGSVNFVEYLSRLRPGLCSWENLHGLKPVHTATERGDPKLVKYLLDMEKDWAVDNHRGREGQTLLHVAASQGRTAVLELLLERGANLSARCHRGATALHYAALAGDKFLPRGEPDCIDALLRHGLDVRVTDNEGNTALHWALKKGCDQAKALLLHGADMEATNNKGESVLHIAKTLEEREVSLFRQDMELEGFRFHWPYSHLMAVRGKPLEEIGQYWGQGLEEGTLPNAHRD